MPLVAGDGGVDGAGPEVDAAGYGLGSREALVAEPVGDRKGARAVVAEDGDGPVLVELVVGAGGDFVHRDQGRAGDLRGGEFPGLADVEDEWGLAGGEAGLEVVDGNFEREVGGGHGYRIDVGRGLVARVKKSVHAEGAEGFVAGISGRRR